MLGRGEFWTAAVWTSRGESGGSSWTDFRARTQRRLAPILRSSDGEDGSSFSAGWSRPWSPTSSRLAQPAKYSSSADVYINQQDIASALTGISSYNYSSAALAVDTQASLADVPAVAARALKLAKLHDRTPAEAARGSLDHTRRDDEHPLLHRRRRFARSTSALLATSYAKAFAGVQQRALVETDCQGPDRGRGD